MPETPWQAAETIPHPAREADPATPQHHWQPPARRTQGSEPPKSKAEKTKKPKPDLRPEAPSQPSTSDRRELAPAAPQQSQGFFVSSQSTAAQETPVGARQSPAASAKAAANGDAETEPPRLHANYLFNPPPPYPAEARAAGEQGRVYLAVQVSEKGDPIDIHIRKSSGSERLDTAAIKAVRQWKFVPAKRGNQAVTGWVAVPIYFNLRKR